ncbi:hypothetical protein ACMHYB_28630 [Sorangium sp. So ce1128]
MIARYLFELETTCARLATSAGWVELDVKDLEILRDLRGSTTFGALASRLSDETLASGAGWNEIEAMLARALKATERGKLSADIAGADIVSGLGAKLFEGLADFLVTRSKQEAVLFLQEHMRDELCKDEPGQNHLGPILLSNTCRALSELDGTISLNAMGTYMNSAARMDLVLLPDSVLQHATAVDPEHHYIYEPGRLVYAVARKIEEGRHDPLDVLASVHEVAKRRCEIHPGATDAGQRCEKTFRLLRGGSMFLRAVRQQKEVEKILGEEDGEAGPRLVAIGLDLEALSGKPLDATRLGKAMSAFRLGVRTTLSIARTIGALKNSAGDDKETPAERRLRLAQATLEASVAMISMAEALRDLLDVQDDEVGQVLNLLKKVALVGRAGLDEDYGTLVLELSRLLAELRQVHRQNAELAAMFSTISRYTPFIVEIASAKDSKDVAAAFEAAAAPVGSYKVKFERSTMALNAFFGLSAGSESILADRVSGTSSTFGGFAPVGVHFSKPFCASGALPLGIMVSVIDLGALTTQRFEQEVKGDEQGESGEASRSATVGFEQLFSPGLFLTVGLGSKDFRTPFTLGGGISFVPNLRQVELTDSAGATTSFNAPVLRFGGFLALDLTLLPIN